MKKDLRFRLKELETAIKALEFATEQFVNKGEDFHLLTIQGQLRALIAPGGKLMTPLLFELSLATGIPFRFYSRTANLSNSEPNIYGRILMPKTWSVFPDEDTSQTTLNDWLEEPIFQIAKNNSFRTRSHALKHIANSSGGAHYADDIRPIVDELARQEITLKTGVHCNGIASFLLDTSLLTLWLSKRLLRLWEGKLKGLNESNNPVIKNLDLHYSRLELSNIMMLEFYTKEQS